MKGQENRRYQKGGSNGAAPLRVLRAEVSGGFSGGQHQTEECRDGLQLGGIEGGPEEKRYTALGLFLQWGDYNKS